MKSKVAVYGRVSTTEQASEGYSIDAQITKGRTYADLSGWEVVDEYRDAGVSGSLSLDERPAGKRLLKDAKAGKFSVVVFTKIDRFARTVRKALEDFAMLENIGVEVVFVEEKIDTTTPQGRMFRSLLLVFAEFEREQIRDRNMSGRYEKAATGGGWPSGPTPFGYRVGKDGNLEIDPNDAPTVRLMFQERANGKTLRAIASEVRARGLRDTLSPSTVANILGDRTYIGEPVTRSLAPTAGAAPVKFEFPAPAIVTPKLWKAANEHTPPETDLFRRRHPYALGGHLVHRHGDESEGRMQPKSRPSKSAERGNIRYYRCYAKGCDSFGEKSGHPARTIRADWVEAAFLLWALDREPGAIPEWTAEAREEARQTFQDPHRPLPPSLVHEAERLAGVLGATLVLQRSDDPARPTVRVRLPGEAVEEWVARPEEVRA